MIDACEGCGTVTALQMHPNVDGMFCAPCIKESEQMDLEALKAWAQLWADCHVVARPPPVRVTEFFAEPNRRGRGARVCSAWNAKKTHCHRGHEFNEENTYHRKGNGARNCRVCARESRYPSKSKELVA